MIYFDAFYFSLVLVLRPFATAFRVESMNELRVKTTNSESAKKFSNPDLTAKGEPRAHVALDHLETLWVNTGSLCNIECEHCYILSSPTNDDLVYFRLSDLESLLEEIQTLELKTKEIGFTGGEPFMNPEMIEMADAALSRGHSVLILTNAMAPMMRPKMKAGLLKLRETYGDKLTLRISLDHYSAESHDLERGVGSFETSLTGVNWLSEHGFQIAVAGRSMWGEEELQARTGYSELFASDGWDIDPDDPMQLVIFPEMDEAADTPEITTGCWDILKISPSSLMCATSRMVVRRKGEETFKVLPCTLIPYRSDFEMGVSLADSLKADDGMFRDGAVKLCHIHCSKFCVLGGGSCSG